MTRPNYLWLLIVVSGLICGCAATKKNRTIKSEFRPGVPGGRFEETYEMSVEVVAVDPAGRRVAFRGKDGVVNTFAADNLVEGLDQYRPGNKFHVLIAREMLVCMNSSDSLPPTQVLQLIAGSQKVQPGVFMASPDVQTGLILSVDPILREAVVQLSNGTVQTVSVRPDVNLNSLKDRSTGTIRITTAMSLLK